LPTRPWKFLLTYHSAHVDQVTRGTLACLIITLGLFTALRLARKRRR